MDKVKAYYHNFIGVNFYYFSLIILVIALPLSPFVTSMAQMWLGINYILEGKFKKKWAIVKTDHILWLYLLLPAVLLFGLWNTSDFAFALYDLKIKVPLLLLPVIIRTSDNLSAKQIQTILWFFTWALFSGTLISMAVYLGFYGDGVSDIRNISIFISHIRFSLMIVFAICYVIWNLWKKHKTNPLIKNLMYIGLIIWFFIFITILRSLTSWIIILLIFYLLIFIYRKKLSNKVLRRTIIIIALLLPLSISAFIYKVYKDYHTIYPINFSELPTHTPRGNRYINDSTKTMTDCGYYVYSLLSKTELRKGWPLISDVPLNTKQKNGYTTEHRVMRYLTSLGLPKDLDGLKQLDKKDIELIENGYATCIHKTKSSPYIKFYETFYDLDIYKRTGNANGKSVSMRIEFVKTGLYIIKNNFWLGVGTGDSVLEYQKAYKNTKSRLHQNNRHRAHNQFLLFLISFGFIGTIFCLFSVFGPFILTKDKSFLLISLCFILFFSMLNEDTLETQAGVTFYILFYSLLVTHNKELNQ